MKTKMSGKSQKQISEMKQHVQILLATPAAMKELIQYFETHGRMLDRQELGAMSGAQSGQPTSNFISCIRFNGIPILPPVMTNSKVDEVRRERHKAVFQEKRLKVRQCKHLVEVANSLVENAEPDAPSDTKSGKTAASRLPLERPLVLKPVVTSAWGSVTTSGGSTTGTQSVDSASGAGPSSLANTFATAEQGQEEFGLQTLDSVCSDFMSLEETLPTDFNGVPLTSVKQQKISHDLLRLSKALKGRDLNSTGESDISDLPVSEYAGQQESEERIKSGSTSVLDHVSSSFCHESQDTVVEATSDNATEGNAAENTSGFMDNSTDGSPAELSSQGEGTFSGAGSANTSGMSSANTTSTTDSHRSHRSSPRSLKSNTVHFASFVTEYIDTSASLSSENITVVKKKLPGDKLASNRPEAKASAVPAVGAQVNKETGQDLLNNVSLSDPDLPLTPSLPPNLPFQSYVKSDPSLSDKENDSGQSNKVSEVRPGVSGSSESSLHPKSERGSAPKSGRSASVSDSQGSCKSDATATTSESSNSTLIEDVAAAAGASQDSTTVLPLNIVEHEAGTKGQRDPPRNTGATEPHKPKKLPPEPPQQSYQQRSARQRKLSGEKDLTANKKDGSDSPSHKGHIRRGSYTLIEPSPALLRAQVTSRREHTEDKTEHSKGNQRNAEDLTKPLNIPLPSSIPSEPEAAGKAEHINKYLSQVQLHNSEDLTASQLSADLSQCDPAMSGHLQSSFNIVQSLVCSQRSLGSTSGTDGEVLQKFQSLRQNLLEQQQKDLEELFVQQRREQMLLQEEIEEHQQRMKEQQEFLASNAPENVKVASQRHEGELSPDSNSGSNTNVKHFTFPSPQTVQVTQHGQAAGPTSQVPYLLNTSATSSSPRVKRPVLRSPTKLYAGRRPAGRVIVPSEAYEPEMQVKFDKLTAAAKGFLSRRLLQSDKVQDLVKTIKDTREFAFSFQSETPIRQGTFSNQDRTLLERIVAQLQAALLDVHEIFFDISIVEKMALIEQTRVNNREKRLKSSTDELLRSSAPRISTATLKAQERRKRAQEAESAVFGASMPRPRTAPSSTTSPRSQASVDLSGPLKRHYQFLLSRALKPAAMQTTHQQHLHRASARSDSSRSEMERPQTAPERTSTSRIKKPVSSSSHGLAIPQGTDSGQAKLNIRPKASQPSGPQSSISKSTKTSKSSKLWR